MGIELVLKELAEVLRELEKEMSKAEERERERLEQESKPVSTNEAENVNGYRS